MEASWYTDRLFINPSYQDAIDTLIKGIRDDHPNVILTGPAGTGKTAVACRVIDFLTPACRSVLLSYPPKSLDEFLWLACKALDIPVVQSSVADGAPALREAAKAAARIRQRIVFFLDNAQDIQESVLVEILEWLQVQVDGRRQFQAVLIGGLALEPTVNAMKLTGTISDNIPAARLSPLDAEEIEAFIALQLSTLAARQQRVFSAQAIECIASFSGGNPRLIKSLCRSAGFAAASRDQKTVTEAIVREAAEFHTLALTAPPDITREPSQRPPARFRPTEGAVMKIQQTAPNGTVDILRSKETHMHRTERLGKLLKGLQSRSPDVEACALISEDGLMIASALPQELDETRVAGMSATLLNLGTRAAVELGRGEVNEVIVRGELGYAVMIHAGRGVLLLVVANESAKLGLIFFDMWEAIKALNEIL
jgi:predicted regulator of Ras-like GTPase activity (Roadblock/LC7/MglB family)/type II secretory pathway predicted ATPase ExeA